MKNEFKLMVISMKKVMIFAFLISLFQMTAFANSGKIWGYIYNGSADSSVVANTDIEFLVYRGHDLIDDSSYVQKSNAAGKYQLPGVPIDSTLIYYPRVNFNSIVYYGRGVRLTENENEIRSDVVVYDTTSQKKDIVFQMEHLFLNVENGFVNVREIFLIANLGNKTYIGQSSEDNESQYVLEFILPKNHKNVELLTPDAQNLVIVGGNRLIDTNLFPPGSKQLSFRYQVPVSGNDWQYSRPILYPSGSVNIFLDDPNLTIEGPGIESMGEFSIRGSTYMRYTITSHLMPGMQLEFKLKNLPEQKISIEWITLIAVAAFLVVGFAYTFLNKKKSKK